MNVSKEKLDSINELLNHVFMRAGAFELIDFHVKECSERRLKELIKIIDEILPKNGASLVKARYHLTSSVEFVFDVEDIAYDDVLTLPHSLNNEMLDSSLDELCRNYKLFEDWYFGPKARRDRMLNSLYQKGLADPYSFTWESDRVLEWSAQVRKKENEFRFNDVLISDKYPEYSILCEKLSKYGVTMLCDVKNLTFQELCKMVDDDPYLVECLSGLENKIEGFSTGKRIICAASLDTYFKSDTEVCVFMREAKSESALLADGMDVKEVEKIQKSLMEMNCRLPVSNPIAPEDNIDYGTVLNNFAFLLDDINHICNCFSESPLGNANNSKIKLIDIFNFYNKNACYHNMITARVFYAYNIPIGKAGTIHFGSKCTKKSVKPFLEQLYTRDLARWYNSDICGHYLE